MQHDNRKKDQHCLAHRKALCHAQPFSRLLKMHLDAVFFFFSWGLILPSQTSPKDAKQFKLFKLKTHPGKR